MTGLLRAQFYEIKGPRHGEGGTHTAARGMIVVSLLLSGKFHSYDIVENLIPGTIRMKTIHKICGVNAAVTFKTVVGINPGNSVAF